MRLSDLHESLRSKKAPRRGYHPLITPEIKEWLRRYRHNCRASEGSGGMCNFVSEVIDSNWGWRQMGGTYCSKDGYPVCTAHFWNILPDGTILDATADQLGKPDIDIIPPSSPEHHRYRYEWSEHANPGNDQGMPDSPLLPWKQYEKLLPKKISNLNKRPPSYKDEDGRTVYRSTTEYDSDWENILNKERGRGWWIDAKDLPRYRAYQKLDQGYQQGKYKPDDGDEKEPWKFKPRRRR